MHVLIELLARGSNPDLPTSDGKHCALSLAVAQGHRHVAAALLGFRPVPSPNLLGPSSVESLEAQANLVHRNDKVPSYRALACPRGLACGWLKKATKQSNDHGGSGSESGENSGNESRSIPRPSPLAIAIAHADPISCTVLLAAAALDGWAAATIADSSTTNSSRSGSGSELDPTQRTLAPLVTPEEVAALLLAFRVEDDAFYTHRDYSSTSSSRRDINTNKQTLNVGNSNGGNFAVAVAEVVEISASTIAAFVERRAVAFRGSEPAATWSLDEDAPVSARGKAQARLEMYTIGKEYVCGNYIFGMQSVGTFLRWNV